jgi:hypothetical protein
MPDPGEQFTDGEAGFMGWLLVCFFAWLCLTAYLDRDPPRSVLVMNAVELNGAGYDQW